MSFTYAIPFAYRYVQPVFGGDISSETGHVLSCMINGSCFSIGNGYFLTAKHVHHQALGSKKVFIGFAGEDPRYWHPAQVDAFEYYSKLDIAILKATPTEAVNQYSWSGGECGIFHEIYSLGYPYGMDSHNHKIVIRGMSGRIVSQFYPSTEISDRAYELSFACPRGLSGGPLLSNKQRVVGVVVGNNITDMVIDSVIEADGSKTYERVESMHLGVAIPSFKILKVHSPLLNCTLEQHLRNQTGVKKKS